MSPMTERFEAHTRTFASLTVVSRMTGLARDAVLSRVFGASAVTDAFFFAFLVPNLFRRLFGEGALGAAFLPTYAQLDRDDPATARRLATLTTALLLAGLGRLTLAGEIVLLVIAKGAGSVLALRLVMIMLPYMPLVCLVAILGAMLQVHGRFGPGASVPIVLNVCIIVAAAGLAPAFGADARGHITAVAAAVLVAGLIQVAWMLWALRDSPWIVRDVSAAREPMRLVAARAAPMMLGLGVLQLNVFFDGVIASYPTTVGPTVFGVDYPLSVGAMAVVSFAQRHYQFPVGVFGIAVATTIYPALSRLTDDDEAFAGILRRGLRFVLFLGLPASAGLILVGPTLTSVIFQGGFFEAGDTQRVTFVLYGYACAVWAYSMTYVLTRAFYAKGDTKTPVKVALAIVVLNLLLNCTLIWTPLREAGLAWSTAACAAIQALVMTALCRRHVQPIADMPLRRSVMQSLAITALMALVVWLVQAALPTAETWMQSLVHLLVAVGAGGAVVVIVAAALRMPELRWAIGRSTTV